MTAELRGYDAVTTAELLARTWHDVKGGDHWFGDRSNLYDHSADATIDYAGLLWISAQMVGRVDSIIDVTAVGEQIMDAYPDGMNPYKENLCLAPPFADAAWGYVMADGASCVLVTHAIDRCDKESARAVSWDELGEEFTRLSRHQQHGRVTPEQGLDWDRVRWVQDGLVFLAPNRSRRHIEGPLHMARWAIYDDGTPAALHWLKLRVDMDPARFTPMALAVLRSMDLANSSNIEVEEPARPQAERERIGEWRVRVEGLVLRPSD